jgi:hypothetical protein
MKTAIIEQHIDAATLALQDAQSAVTEADARADEGKAECSADARSLKAALQKAEREVTAALKAVG